ncbi:hypothetical protein [Embleya sp. AB8]|uniref:hypothetical protein n=1 Tax=Embleya sp. AB8 TaxID=3156304 RepID=UPI003C748632
MPGQRKRKQRHQEQARRNAARFAPDAGHWEVVFTTRDESEWNAYIRRLRAEDPGPDRSALSMDIFCGRLTHPTTYRLRRFVPTTTAAGNAPAEKSDESPGRPG